MMVKIGGENSEGFSVLMFNKLVYPISVFLWLILKLYTHVCHFIVAVTTV